MSQPSPHIAVLAEGLCKHFGRLKANDQVNLRVEAATIHAVVGENGAGKSTLMNMLYGVMRADSGSITLFGKRAKFDSPAAALAAGVGMVSQHYALIPEFSILENLMLTQPSTGWKPMQRAQVQTQAEKFTEGLGLNIDWNQSAGSLSVSQQQKVEILRLLMRGCRILIFDEPTAVLPPADADSFYELLHRFTDEGRTAIVVTHRLQEVVQHAHHVTVLRMGRSIADYPVTTSLNLTDLSNQIIGSEHTPAEMELVTSAPSDELAVELRHVNINAKATRSGLNDFSLSVRKGEVMGIAGVDGSGQAELVELLVGLRHCPAQQLLLQGTAVGHLGVRDRLRRGVRYIAEDRHSRATISEWSLIENALLGHQREPQFGQWTMQPKAMSQFTQQIIERFRVKAESPEQSLSTLSGGNQQKLVVGRALYQCPALLVAGHPTRGLDTQSAEFVRQQITAACASGCAAVVVSYDISELVDLCHQVAVLYNGRLMGVLDGNAANREAIGKLMVGVRE